MSDLRSLTMREESGQPPATVEVTVKHQGIESRIIGTPDGVVCELLAYFSKLYPSLEIAAKLLLSVDNSEFLQSLSGVVAASPEGLVILKNTSELRDKELVLLQLAGAKLTHLLSKKESDTMALEDMTKNTGRSTGTVAGRLSELCNDQLVERVGKGSYRLTTMGARTVVKNLMPKMAGFPDR